MTTHRSVRHAPLLPLAQRRVSVLTTYLGYLGMTLAWSLLGHPWRWLLVLPLGIATLLAFYRLVQPRVMGTSDGTDQELDERQLQVRNVGYLNAYRGLGLLVMLFALYAYVASDNGWWLPTTSNARTAVFCGIWGLTLTLPSAVLAWTEPDTGL
jgi:ABC-type amino acid transport system permease subunit